jgi:hypothetical protein
VVPATINTAPLLFWQAFGAEKAGPTSILPLTVVSCALLRFFCAFILLSFSLFLNLSLLSFSVFLGQSFGIEKQFSSILRMLSANRRPAFIERERLRERGIVTEAEREGNSDRS